jgi:homoserine acetyltransferase
LSNGVQDIIHSNLTQKILNHAPGGGSMKTLLHYIQLMTSGDFRMFDYGEKCNVNKYSKETPPNYILNNITLPLIVFSSTDDWLSTIPDITNLLSSLSNSVEHHVVQSNEFRHMDFLWADEADILVYYIILDTLQRPIESFTVTNN